MESYQSWLGEGPELSVLRILGLFDRPADEKALAALLKPPSVRGLTESLIDLSPTERRAVVARLRRARLLAAEDPHNPAHLDTHERDPTEVERLASELIVLSTRHKFAFWSPGANIFRGWARSVFGEAVEGISWIENGIEDYRANGAMIAMPLWLALKAEALHLADRTAEALEAVREAEVLIKRFEGRWWYAEVRRLCGVLLAALCANRTQIEASFRDSIRIAKQQKATRLLVRTETTYAEYLRQKASASGIHQFQLPID